MNAATEKILGFLNQFGSEAEFVTWCEGQGVKGRPGSMTRCIVAQAVKRATGLEQVWVVPKLDSADIGTWEDHVSIPAPLAATPTRFDLGLLPPHLLMSNPWGS